MSIEAMKAVWQHSRTTGNARMVLTLIANNANDAGWNSYPKQQTLAAHANIAKRTVEKAIATAIDLGELEVHRPDRSKQNRYSIMLPGLAIYDDEEERERRDSEYKNMRLGRAEATRINRANRRSEEPHVQTGPRPSDPQERAGGSRTGVRVGAARTDGSEPQGRAAPLKEETPKPLETPLKQQRARDVDLIIQLIESEYPIPIGRHSIATRLAAEERVLAGDTAESIRPILQAWKNHDRWHDENGRYIPNPQNFLGERRYRRMPDGSPAADATDWDREAEEIRASRAAA